MCILVPVVVNDGENMGGLNHNIQFFEIIVLAAPFARGHNITEVTIHHQLPSISYNLQ
jgi:hypothetical protein